MNEPERRTLWVSSPNLVPTPLLLLDPAAPHASWTALLVAPDGATEVVMPLGRHATEFHVHTSLGLFVCPLRRVYLEGVGLWIDTAAEGEEKALFVKPTPPPLPASPATLGAPVTGFFMPSLAPLEPDFLSAWHVGDEPATPAALRALVERHAVLDEPPLGTPLRPFPVHVRALGLRGGTTLDAHLCVLQAFHELASLRRAPRELVPFVKLARECDVVVTATDWALVWPKEVVTTGWIKSLPVAEGAQVLWGKAPEELRQGFSYRLGAPLWFTCDHVTVGGVRWGETAVAAVVGPAAPRWLAFPAQ
jgi:hypothetical protein